MYVRILAASALLLFSCSDDPTSTCGTGTQFDDGGEKVCLFTNAPQGLACPLGVPEQIQYSDGAIVCSSSREVSGELARQLETQGYIPESDLGKNNTNNKRNNATNNTTNNGTTNNGIVGTPIPIQFHLKYTAEMPETVYYQKLNRTNAVGWFTVRREGKLVLLSPPCGVSECGKDNAETCQVQETELFLDNELSNDLLFDWDGFSFEETNGCVEKGVPDKAGLWTVEFCISPSVVDTDDGGSILNGAVNCVSDTFIPGMRREIISDYK